jgi:hypothetical protein
MKNEDVIDKVGILHLEENGAMILVFYIVSIFIFTLLDCV